MFKEEVLYKEVLDVVDLEEGHLCETLLGRDDDDDDALVEL